MFFFFTVYVPYKPWKIGVNREKNRHQTVKKSAPKIHHFFTVSFSPFTSSWLSGRLKYFTGTSQQILKVFHRPKLALLFFFFTARLCRGSHANKAKVYHCHNKHRRLNMSHWITVVLPSISYWMVAEINTKQMKLGIAYLSHTDDCERQRQHMFRPKWEFSLQVLTHKFAGEVLGELIHGNDVCDYGTQSWVPPKRLGSRMWCNIAFYQQARVCFAKKKKKAHKPCNALTFWRGSWPWDKQPVSQRKVPLGYKKSGRA